MELWIALLKILLILNLLTPVYMFSVISINKKRFYFIFISFLHHQFVFIILKCMSFSLILVYLFERWNCYIDSEWFIGLMHLMNHDILVWVQIKEKIVEWDEAPVTGEGMNCLIISCCTIFEDRNIFIVIYTVNHTMT